MDQNGSINTTKCIKMLAIKSQLPGVLHPMANHHFWPCKPVEIMVVYPGFCQFYPCAALSRKSHCCAMSNFWWKQPACAILWSLWLWGPVNFLRSSTSCKDLRGSVVLPHCQESYPMVPRGCPGDDILTTSRTKARPFHLRRCEDGRAGGYHSKG